MISIRQATIKDLIELSGLFDQYRVWYRKESDLDGSRSFLKARMDHNESVIYLAFEERNAIGFTQLYPLFSSTRMKKTWLLNDLFVDPGHRGKGASKLLIQAAKDLCTSTKAFGVSLETEKSNDIGNQLYPSVGFTLNETQNFYEWESGL